MKQIKLLIKRLWYLLYFGIILFKDTDLKIFFNQFKRQIYSHSSQVGLFLNLNEYEFPTIETGIKYTLNLATKEDMDEVMKKAKSESKEMLQKLLFRRWMFEDGYRNCYVARTADTNDICTVAFIIFPTDNTKVEGKFRNWFVKLRPDEAILEGAYTFEKYRGNRLHPAIIIDRLRICKQQGIKWVLGYIEENNEASLKGAERAGFKRFGYAPEFKFMFFTFRKYKWYHQRQEIKTASIRTIDPITERGWDEFIKKQAYHTIFHTSAWAQVLKDTYDYSSRYHIFENENHQISAAIPFYNVQSKITGKRLVCLPFSDYCWPLGDNDTTISSILNVIKKEIDAGKQGFEYLEVRGWQTKQPEAALNLTNVDHYVRYMLELEPDYNALSQKFHHSVRRGIHQAEKRDVTIRLTNAEEDMERFYNLHLSTRKKLGVFPQPRNFFKNIYHHIILQNYGFIGIAEFEGKTIAAVVFFVYGDTIYYKYNASDEKFLRKRPNHLIIWEAIKYACANNYKYFDLGRCAPEEKGLRVFKNHWGAKEINLPYYYYPNKKGLINTNWSKLEYHSMRLCSKIMPRFMYAIIGSYLYKHFG